MRFFDTDRWNEIWQTISRNRKRSIMTALGVFWGIFMLHRTAGSRHGAGTPVPRPAGRHVHQHGAAAKQPHLGPLQGHAHGTLVENGQRRSGSRQQTRRGGVHLRRHLGQRTPLQLQRAQGRLSDDGIHARLPEDQPAEDHRRPLHQRGRHGAQAQGLRHRHAGAERPLSGRTRPDGQSHQGRRKLLHHHRRHAPRIVGHVVQRRRTHGCRPDLAGAADVRLRHARYTCWRWPATRTFRANRSRKRPAKPSSPGT